MKLKLISTLFLFSVPVFSATVFCNYQDAQSAGTLFLSFGPQGEPPPGMEITFSSPAFKQRLRWDTAQMRPQKFPEIGVQGWKIYTVGVQPLEFPIKKMLLEVPFVGTEPNGTERSGIFQLELQTGENIAGPVSCYTPAKPDHKRWITSDFSLETVENSSKLSPVREPSNCRAEIAKAICLVDPAKPGEDENLRLCLSGSSGYAKYFEALYDAYPAALQRMFCSVRKIFVEKTFFGTAYAGLLKDQSGKLVGAKIGIRKSVLDENLTLQRWASWKEQLSFGGIAESYTLTPDLPMIRSQSAPIASDFLYFVITHEFGHIFDFANDLNKLKDPSCFEHVGEECEMAKGSWGAISWITDLTPKPENEFAHRRGLCFYDCKGKFLSKKAIFPLYHGLAITDFISTYATTEPWDDFADSLAYYITAQKLHTRYAIDTKQGPSYSITRKLYSGAFRSKLEYIENFLQREDILYP